MSGEVLKLTTYFGERDRAAGRPLGDELLRVYGEHRLRASVLLRGVEGFGAHHSLHTDRLLTLSEDLPVISVAVDTRERIEAVLPLVRQAQRRGLITLERAQGFAGESESARLPDRLHEGTKLTVYVGRRDRVNGRPAHVALTDLLHRRGVAGATVLLGVDGTIAGRRVRARFFARNANVPTMIVAVGAGERIAELSSEIGAMLPASLVTLERVRVCKRDGRLLAAPHKLQGRDEHGLALWQKLTIYTSQADTHEGRPINMQVVRRLREAEAAGVTCVRGIWGFHGDHAPHGDRFFQLRRHVPVVTTVIDSPEAIARSFQIVDELTAEHGLVTSEVVPAPA